MYVQLWRKHALCTSHFILKLPAKCNFCCECVAKITYNLVSTLFVTTHLFCSLFPSETLAFHIPWICWNPWWILNDTQHSYSNCAEAKYVSSFALPLLNKADISLALTEDAHATCEINVIRMSKARQQFRDIIHRDYQTNWKAQTWHKRLIILLKLQPSHE